MAQILPFKGIRYNTQIAGNIDKLVCPPYDIISDEDRIYYHNIHPYNYVRLILGEERPTDDDKYNRFIRSEEFINDWLEKGILAYDDECFYIYEQNFEIDNTQKCVRGITAAVKIHEYDENVILPHENTLAKPKSQLAQLIRYAKANLDSVYGLYADPEAMLSGVINNVISSEPIVKAVDKDNVLHKLWMVCDEEQVSYIKDFFKDKQIAIADGHHRYETALAYRNEMREKNPNSEDMPWDYVLMTLADVYQKDLTVYPTHRVLASLADDKVNNIEALVSDLYYLKDSTKEDLVRDMALNKAIGLYKPNMAKILIPKNDYSYMLEGCDALRKLEMAQLHKLILERVLDIGEDKLRDQTHIIYTHTAQTAFDLVDSGERQMAFLLNNIDVKSVLEISASGEKMPQKATYFYPKLLSGLVCRRLV
ncbi:MAG: DUF1015 domain-containing protein [Armatimonadota bacterium]